MSRGTGSSSACIRQHYSNAESVYMARYALDVLTNWSEYLKIKSESKFHKTGCFLIENYTSESIDHYSHVLSETNSRFAILNKSREIVNNSPINIDFGENVLFEPDSGYTDAYSVTSDLVKAARSKGAHFIFGKKVCSVTNISGKVKGIKLENGEIFEADQTVLCTATKTNNLLAKMGLNPYRTSKRPVHTIHIAEPSIPKFFPITADLVNGIYFRPESGGILVGSIAPEDESIVISEDLELPCPTDEYIGRLIAGTLHRFPNIKVNQSNCNIVKGYYDVNDINWMPIVTYSGIPGLNIAFATSGHGFKLSFAIAELVANQICNSPLPVILKNISNKFFSTMPIIPTKGVLC